MKRSIRLLAGLFIIIVCAAAAIAQTNRGGISGTVFDKTGAVVPGARVTITNTGTNRSQTLTTSEEGSYSAAALEPVVYRITVEAQGFKKAVVDSIKVDTAVTATVNVTLEPGAVETIVNVTSEGALLNVESGTPGRTITERQIRDLPLDNRSVLDLVLSVGNVSGVAGTEDSSVHEQIKVPGC